MIVEEVEYVRGRLPEEDVYADSLSRLLERLRFYGETDGDEELMHTVHQVAVLKRFMSDAFFEDLEKRAKDNLQKESDMEADASPNRLIRVVNRIDLEEVVDDQYGLVQTEETYRRVAAALGISEEAEPGDLTEFASVIESVIQQSYDELDQEYRSEVEQILDDLEENSGNSADPVSSAKTTLEEHTADWHKKVHGWP